jgi:hypothetical protein
MAKKKRREEGLVGGTKTKHLSYCRLAYTRLLYSMECRHLIGTLKVGNSTKV